MNENNRPAEDAGETEHGLQMGICTEHQFLHTSQGVSGSLCRNFKPSPAPPVDAARICPECEGEKGVWVDRKNPANSTYMQDNDEDEFQECRVCDGKGTIPQRVDAARPELPELWLSTETLLAQIVTPAPRDEFSQGDMNGGQALFWSFQKHFTDDYSRLVKLCRRYVTTNRQHQATLRENEGLRAEMEDVYTLLEDSQNLVDQLRAELDAIRERVNRAVTRLEKATMRSRNDCAYDAIEILTKP